MTSQHTPGPWDRGPRCGSVGAAGSITHRIHIIAPSSEPWVATIVAMVPSDNSVGEANARLIAAAPELFAVLSAGVAGLTQSACFTCGAEPGCNIDCRGCQWVTQARYAIAKAEGK